MRPIKLVTFDVTGTLLFFKTPILQKYLETGLKFGIKADSTIIQQSFKDSFKILNKEQPNFGKETGLHWKMWWEQLVQKTFAGYINDKDKRKITAISENLIAFHTTKDAFVKRPGTDDLLKYLKAKPILLGVISNYDPRLHEILEIMELTKYFDFILGSYEFGHSKPDARIFREALRLGKCISGGQAIHIGNNLELDYLGAKKAGLRALLISPDEEDLKHSEIIKNEVFEDFFKLKLFLKSQLN